MMHHKLHLSFSFSSIFFYHLTFSFPYAKTAKTENSVANWFEVFSIFVKYLTNYTVGTLVC